MLFAQVILSTFSSRDCSTADKLVLGGYSRGVWRLSDSYKCSEVCAGGAGLAIDLLG